MQSYYEIRRDAITTTLWEVWTKNGLGLDGEMRFQTGKTVQDIVADTYQEDFTDSEWFNAALARLQA